MEGCDMHTCALHDVIMNVEYSKSKEPSPLHPDGCVAAWMTITTSIRRLQEREAELALREQQLAEAQARWEEDRQWQAQQDQEQREMVAREVELLRSALPDLRQRQAQAEQDWQQAQEQLALIQMQVRRLNMCEGLCRCLCFCVCTGVHATQAGTEQPCALWHKTTTATTHNLGTACISLCTIICF